MPSVSSNPAQQLQNTGQQLQNTSNGLQNAANGLAEEALTLEDPKTYPKGYSGAHLEDAGFMDRAIHGGVANTRESGVSISLQGSAQSSLPFFDYAEAGPESEALMMQDHHIRGGFKGDIRYDSKEGKNGSFFGGIRGDFGGGGRSDGIAENAGDMVSLMGQAEGIQSGLNGLQSQIQNVANNLQNNPNFQRLGQISQQMQNNPQSVNQATLNELQTLLNSGDIQQLLSDLDSTIGQANQVLGDTNAALGTLGDGTRTLFGQGAVRGAGELYGGYRTKGYDLGDSGWKMRLGVEASVILPMKTPGGAPKEFPEFKYMMGKISTQAQMTTKGIAGLQNSLGAIQNDLQNLQSAVQGTNQAMNNAQQAANQTSGNTLSRLNQMNQAVNQLNQSANQASTAGQSLNQNLGQLEDSMNDVTVDNSVGLTTITPTAPVGFGIRDIGAQFYGPVTAAIDASVEVGVMNPVGYLQGQESHYKMAQDNEGNPHLEKVGTKNRNVFHDFYDPAAYVGAGVTLNKDSRNYRTDFRFRLEKSLTSDKMRGSAVVRQQLGPMSLRTGVLSTDLRGDAKPMFMGGVGFGRKDQFTINVATDSLNPSKASNVQVMAGFKIPF